MVHAGQVAARLGMPRPHKRICGCRGSFLCSGRDWSARFGGGVHPGRTYSQKPPSSQMHPYSEKVNNITLDTHS